MNMTIIFLHKFIYEPLNLASWFYFAHPQESKNGCVKKRGTKKVVLILLQVASNQIENFVHANIMKLFK